MKYTHQIDFFTNTRKIRVEDGIVVAVAPDRTFASCCADCQEDIVGYWLINTLPDGSLVTMCPSDDCTGGGDPVTELVIKEKK